MYKNTTYPSGGKSIEISFNQEKIDAYLKSHGITKIDDSVVAVKLFLLATADFFNKTIDSELLSGIANRIYYVYKFKFQLEFGNDLDQVLDHISELEYAQVTNDTQTVAKYLKELKEFFIENEPQKTESDKHSRQ